MVLHPEGVCRRPIPSVTRARPQQAGCEQSAAHLSSAQIREAWGFLDLFEDPEGLPARLTEADINTLATEFAEAGFTSALNWYRNFDRNWQLTAPWEEARSTGCPAATSPATVTWCTPSRAWTN